MCLELVFVWLVYFIFGLVADYDMPVWLTAMVVVLVDRIIGLISAHAARKRSAIGRDAA